VKDVIVIPGDEAGDEAVKKAVMENVFWQMDQDRKVIRVFSAIT
jgi:hypothetical protein